MSNDNFLKTLFNAGEQIRSDDFNQVQRQLHMMIMEMLAMPRAPQLGPLNAVGSWEPSGADMLLGGDANAFPSDVAFCPFPSSGYVYPTGNVKELSCVAGPVVQYVSSTGISDPTEATPILLVYWLGANEFTLTTATGDATNPRIDLVEMKLQMVDDGSVARTFNVESVRAALDLAPLTANCETVVEARSGGAAGNSLTLALVADGAGAGSLTQNGNAWTFHYQSTVTTVANFETAIQASSMLQVRTTDASGTLASPGDTFGATAFTGGVDQRLVSQTINKKRRVSATFQIKQGTPAATPAYPTPTAGFVPIASVHVPATHASTHSLANLRDNRYPLGGVRVYDVFYNQFNLNFAGTTWTLNHNNCRLDSAGTAGSIIIPCPSGGHHGRVIAVSLFGTMASTVTPVVKVGQVKYSNGATTFNDKADLAGFVPGVLDATVEMITANDVYLMQNKLVDLGTRLASSRIGVPLWSNGERCGPAFEKGDTQSLHNDVGYVAIKVTADNVASYMKMGRFYVAHGM